MPSRKKKMLELAGTGDDGQTGLLGGGRAAKDDLRIEGYGTIDEASSAIGLAKALTPHPRVRTICEEVQRGLYSVGAEVATNPESKTSFAHTSAENVDRLDELIAELERSVTMPDGFILPGATPASGALDLARAITRRAERRYVGLERADAKHNHEVARWLNRLSLLLFVLGRYEEDLAGRRAEPAKSKPRRSG
ncbi:MAG: cob(I)yrinic acid a,c-diamide adenosyltransferase [Candidatus Dormiibacterota bacterium]